MKKRTTKILEILTKANPVNRKTVELHNFLAELFVNEETDPPVHHYVVMRKGSVEILGWGQERSGEVAERAARNYMEVLHRRMSAAG